MIARRVSASTPMPRVDARTEVVHEHVSGSHQLVQQRQPFGVLEIERHRPLASVETGKHPGDPVVHRAERAHEVTAAGAFDFDDVGSLLRENRRRERAGGRNGEIDHPDAAQRCRHVTRPSITPLASSSATRSRREIQLGDKVDRRGGVVAVGAGEHRRRRAGANRSSFAHVRVDRDLVDGEHRCNAGVERGQAGYPVVTGMSEEALLQGGRRLCLPVGVFVGIDEIGQIDRLAEIAPEPLLERGHTQPLVVAAAIRVVTRVVAGEQAHRADVEAVIEILIEHHGHEPQHTVGGCDIEDRSGAGAGPRLQRRKDGDDRVHPSSGAVADRGTGYRGPAVGAGLRLREQAGHRCIVQVVPGPSRTGTVLAKAADRAIHDARIDRVHGLRADTETVGYARTECFDDHIRAPARGASATHDRRLVGGRDAAVVCRDCPRKHSRLSVSDRRADGSAVRP